MGSAVPSRVSLLIPILRLDLVLTYRIPPDFRGGVHLSVHFNNNFTGNHSFIEARTGAGKNSFSLFS